MYDAQNRSEQIDPEAGRYVRMTTDTGWWFRTCAIFPPYCKGACLI